MRAAPTTAPSGSRSAMTTSTAPAGWYPDPGSIDQRRYWDGQQWTEHVAPRPDATDGNRPAAATSSSASTAAVATTAAAASRQGATEAKAARAVRDERPLNTYGLVGMLFPLASVVLVIAPAAVGFTWIAALPAVVLGFRGTRE